ncbi:hypothetical protein COCVIDRAFT_36725 [Bipolaris victoriae FI3]|uniref:NmrA-like domain-containing protein n=1 Tax=Bipolaris victoriae (strain FI3) TaxID=930091 RepID=W7EW61_BIPV3|nr:hypothetical protein COCVIDRAFT_36725 [Bipolaris victoriae FI3]
MVKIALAGGTSGIGLAIHNVLKAEDMHEYVIFTRTPSDDAKAIVVDYTSTSGLAEALKAQSIHTVISALSIGDESSGQAQLNLIEASVGAGCVKRFIPSEFGADYHKEMVKHPPSYTYKFKAREALAKTDLEYSLVCIGIFLDFWGYPHVRSVLDPRKIVGIFIDLAHNFAAIPGDGETSMVFTHTADTARFVVGMMDVPNWPESAFFAADRLTLKQFVQRAEQTKGVKFEVHYDTEEDIRAGKMTLPPNVREWLPSPEWIPMFSAAALSYLGGGFDMDMTKCKNDWFPGIKPLKVQDVIDAWNGR